MSNSLQDQLFKAGLISEQQLEKTQNPAPRYKPKRDGDTRGRQRPQGQRGGPARADGREGQGAQGQRRQRPAGGRPGPRPPGDRPSTEAGAAEEGAATRKRRRRGGRRGAGPASVAPSNAPTVDVQKLRSDQQRSRELLRDSRLAGESAQVRRKREARMRLEALIDELRCNDSGAEIAFYFTRGKRIRRVFVTEQQRAEIVAGTLAVAVLGADVHVIPAGGTSRLEELVPDAYFHTGDGTDAPPDAAPDEYAGFEVPDDLVW